MSNAELEDDVVIVQWLLMPGPGVTSLSRFGELLYCRICRLPNSSLAGSTHTGFRVEVRDRHGTKPTPNLGLMQLVWHATGRASNL